MKKLLIGLLISIFCIQGNGFAASTATCIDTDTKLMLHMDGTNGSTTFTDSSSSAKTMTANNQAQITTGQSVFGGASGVFDGNGDTVSTPDSTDFDIGTGDFTIDFRIRFTTAPNNQYIFASGAGPDTGCKMAGGTELDCYFAGTTSNNYWAWTPSNTTWYHVAITRSGTDIRLFIDGTQQGSTLTNSKDIQNSATFHVGGFDSSFAGNFPGDIDEFRIVKGTAVWTANFTPPSAAYANTCTVSRANTLFMD